MSSIDMITILGNISRTLHPVQHLITGGAYLLGIGFFFSAIMQLMKVADKRAQSSNQGGMFPVLMNLLFGALLVYLPTALDVASNSVFGVGNILTYSPSESNSIYSTMGIIIRTAGILWFVRGCVLVVHSSQPGAQNGAKGLVFIFAGILSINFDNTISMLNSSMGHIVTWSAALKNSQGF